MRYTVKEIAELINGTVIGDESVEITETTSLDKAQQEEITFAVGDYVNYLEQAHAGAVIVEQEVQAPMPIIVVDNAKVAFTKVLELFHPSVTLPKGIHETVILGKNITIGENVTIAPYTVIYDNAVIGDNVVIYPNCYIGHNVQIGEDSVLYPSVVIHQNCKIGKRVILRANAIIGGEGFGFATENGKHTHIPQVGNVILEDDVEVGSCSTIDNATMGSTRVRRGTKIDNLVHLGHNVEIGEDCFLCAQVGIAGSTKCGNHCIFAGQVGSTGHITIGDNCTFAGRTGITGHVPSDGQYAGFPMRPHKEWLKGEVYNSKLPELVKRIKALEKELKRIQEEL